MKKAEAALVGASYWSRVAERSGPTRSADGRANLQEPNHSTKILQAGLLIDLMLSGNLYVAAGSPEDARRLVADAELTTFLVMDGQRLELKAYPIDIEELRIEESNDSFNPLASIEGCEWHYQYSPPEAQYRADESICERSNFGI